MESRGDAVGPSIRCTKVLPTERRTGAAGTYVVQISLHNQRRLHARAGQYVRVTHGEAWVHACLQIDPELDDDSIRIDQTLRMALALKRFLPGDQSLEYVPESDELAGYPETKEERHLEHPVVVFRSRFRGPGLLARWLRQQYLVCAVHYSQPQDMEKPIARVSEDSLDVLGIDEGDKVQIVGERRTLPLRCLALDPADEIPTEPMKKKRTPWWHDLDEDHRTPLPFITLDRESRRLLGDLVPWQPVFVGRDPRYVLASEFREVMLAVALGVLGGVFFFQDNRIVQGAILTAGFGLAIGLIILKIRSRI